MPDKILIGGIVKSLIYFLDRIGLKLEISMLERSKGKVLF